MLRRVCKCLNQSGSELPQHAVLGQLSKHLELLYLIMHGSLHTSLQAQLGDGDRPSLIVSEMSIDSSFKRLNIPSEFMDVEDVAPIL